MRSTRRALLLAALALLSARTMVVTRAAEMPSGTRVERNVIYGMYSGAALLLDVYRPAKPNGFGVVFVAGSGFQADPAYGARPIKETQIDLWGPPLIAGGYTVFSINHRGAPRFHYPAAVDDIQRAIRFVRSHATDYGIDAAQIGGLGGSSGGNLIGLAALRAGPGLPDDPDVVYRAPATLQAIVLRAAVTDLRDMPTPAGANFVVSYMEVPPGNAAAVKALYEAASPVTQIGPKAPPTLLIHGDADALVPHAQSAAMETALRKAGVATRLVTVPGGVHGADFGGGSHPGWPNYFAETVAWFDKYLRGR
jgi:acetyl esterase/lipase